MAMPNYHLFTLYASQQCKLTVISYPQKSKIDLDLRYQRLVCRSIKTLLLANQANLWANASIIVHNDLILTSDHNIVTIRN